MLAQNSCPEPSRNLRYQLPDIIKSVNENCMPTLFRGLSYSGVQYVLSANFSSYFDVIDNTKLAVTFVTTMNVIFKCSFHEWECVVFDGSVLYVF